jgi:hypothetical protein
MTGATSGAGTTYPPGAPEFTAGFYLGSCYLQMFCFILITYVSNLHLISHWTKRQEEFEETKGVIEEAQWPKEKGQNDKQRSTKYTHKTKDRATRTQLKCGCKF